MTKSPPIFTHTVPEGHGETTHLFELSHWPILGPIHVARSVRYLHASVSRGQLGDGDPFVGAGWSFEEEEVGEGTGSG